ncbi:hypothetical protein [Pseudofrankia sp. DC12]|uniref:hypothetical protein n=1 Tax=Pseudofrankia sp. DC12 TaxID=683315 RepID=UPI0005F7A18A|nr:hypothetical protein [Pseudofrankia sp. DC12]
MTGTRSPGEETAARRRLVVDAVAAADPSLPVDVVTGIVEAVNGAALRVLAAALAADPTALAVGAPTAVGRLVTALIAAGSTLPTPACALCGRVGAELIRDENGAGLCPRCRHRQLATACARCGIVKPVGGRDAHGQPVCARCSDRSQRRCGVCGALRRIGRRAHDGQPDVCVNCYRLPEAVCAVCGRRRPCAFADTDTPICKTCAPRRTAPCARCGQDRPPAARWPEGPVCDPCYTAALRHRGLCASCGTTRRLVHPPGPDATTCADCAGLPASHTCADCGIEDKLFTAGRCAPCALRHRSAALLAAGADQVPAALTGVHQAICAAANPYSALNWLRTGAAAGLLADLAAGRLATTHDALDAHPRRAAADYLRALLVAHQLLPARDDALARAEQRLTARLAAVDPPEHRRILTAYATWRVLRRLRRRAEHRRSPRTWTRYAETRVHVAIRFLGWLHDRGTALADLDQSTLDLWLTTTGPAAANIRDFLNWATDRDHTPALTVPTSRRRTGPATSENERIALLARLLHDDTLELTDRVAGALLLLYGQQLSRITALTTAQITQSGDTVHVQFGTDRVALPDPLDDHVLRLRAEGRPYTGLGAATTGWLFPGLLAGQPMTPSHLGARLRKLGVHATAGRRAALTHLASELPAAVLADLISLHPVTAARWTSDTGGTWNRYAAALVQDRNHQP